MTDKRWLILLCLSRMGFALISTAYSALIPTLQHDWHMSASQAGLVQSAWHAAYIFSLVVASLLYGRYGAKRTFLGMSYLACATAFLFAVGATGFTSAFCLYGLAGLCAGGSYVPGLTLIAERFSPATRGRAMGASMGAYIAAASLGYAIGLIGTSALAGVFGTRAGFLLAASGSLFGWALAIAALRKTDNLVASGTRGASWRSLVWLWRHKPSRYIILAYAIHAWELLGMWAWLPAFLSYAVASQRTGTSLLPLATGASLAALTHLVSTAGSLGGGRLSDHWGRTRVILLMSICSVVCSLIFGWLLAAPLWLLVGVAVFYNVTAIGDSAIFSAALSEVVPARHLATAYALRSIMGFGLGALSPWLFGCVLDAFSGATGNPTNTAWGVAWSALGLGALAGPLLTMRLQRLAKTQRR